MQPLTELAGLKLEWREPKAMGRRYELRSGAGLYATLEFQSAWGTLATAVTSSGTRTFKRVGFLDTRVTVRAPGSEADLAIYQPRFWGDGVLTLADGSTFRWRPANFWSTEWAFYASGDRPLVTFHSGVPKESVSDLFRSQAAVTLDHQAGRHPHLELLLTLGWYLHLMHQMDASVATCTTVAVIS